MARPSRHPLLVLLVSSLTTLACGRLEPREERNLRQDGDLQRSDVTPHDLESTGGAKPGSLQFAFDTALSPLFDRQSSHDASGHYFQRDPALVDLFSDVDETKGESLLCWPAAMAFQVNYQTQRKRAPLTQLGQNLTSLMASPAADQVRWFADHCNFDKNRGTNVPEAVHCLAKFYAAHGHESSLSVIGVDAQWKPFGLFPAATQTFHRQIQASDVMAALDRDSSMVVLLGYYERSSTGQWTRRTGHFVSVTGYSHRTIWSESELQLHVVNPAVDYRGRSDETTFDRIYMRQIPDDSELRRIPEALAYTLDGASLAFSGYTAILESLIVFSAKPQ